MIDVVSVDDYLGGFLATSHLASLGHIRIAALAGTMTRASEKYRYQAYRQVLDNNKLEHDENLISYADYTIAGGKKAALKLLDSPDSPTAIFAFNDAMAIGVYQAAKELGLMIPEDLSVIGFDNTILTEIVDPPLTTIAQPIHEMGRQVMDLLVQEIEGTKKMKQRIILPPELIVRNSTTRSSSSGNLGLK